MLFTGMMDCYACDHHLTFHSRDCKADNLMAGTVSLFSAPPHPARRFMRLDYKGRVSVSFSRTRKPVKYYLIDFDLSEVYRPEDAPHFRQPPWGGDKSVPEFSVPNSPPCNPFAVDVYCMGNCIREDYLDVCFSVLLCALTDQ